MTPFSEDIYEEEQYTAPLGIIALAGAQELAKGIDRYLVDWYNKKSKTTPRNAPRLSSEANIRASRRATAKPSCPNRSEAGICLSFATWATTA